MPCTVTRTDRGVVIACSRGRRPARCGFCTAPHTALCDWPLESLGGKTCDARLCERHRARQGPDVDYCPPHARQAARLAAEGV